MSNSKIALVTGSSGGIGSGIAKSLLKNKFKVILHGLEPVNEAAGLIADMEKYGEALGYYQIDLSNATEIEETYNKIISTHGNIDILVNNAGLQFVSEITDFPVNKWEKILSVNLSSAFHMMKLALPHMQKQGWGRVVNIASAHGIVASENKSAYVASKHGLIGLTKVAALENAEKGITCNAICPGWVLTPLVKQQILKISQEQNISFDEAKHNLLMEKQPSGQFVEAEHIGDYVSFLCSDSASQINGASLSIDGGWVAR